MKYLISILALILIAPQALAQSNGIGLNSGFQNQLSAENEITGRTQIGTQTFTHRNVRNDPSSPETAPQDIEPSAGEETEAEPAENSEKLEKSGGH
ncbi:MAG: hypothetical protein AAF204_03085 [Pseudomonadota bacterium]